MAIHVDYARLAREGIRPEIVCQPLYVLSREIHFDVLNAGKGVARGCAYVLLSSDQQHYVAGTLGTGILRPGEGAMIKTLLPAQRSTLWGVLVARDVQGNVWAWDLQDSAKRRIKMKPDEGGALSLKAEDFLRVFFPKLRLVDMERCYSVSATDRDKEAGRSAERGQKPTDPTVQEMMERAAGRAAPPPRTVSEGPTVEPPGDGPSSEAGG